MRRLAHSAVLLALVALFTVGGMVVVVSPASADTGGSFDPSNFALNADPLVSSAAVKGGSFGGVTSEGQMAGMLLNKVRYAKGWTAITKRLGFGASGIQADATAATQLKQLERAYAPVASKLAPALKVVDGVATVVFAGQMGVSLGAGADRAVGIDVDAGLCASSPDGVFSVVASILVFAGAANCDQYKITQEMKALLAADHGSGITGGVSCGPNGGCIKLVSDSVYVYNYHELHEYCLSLTGTPGNATMGIPFVFSTNGVSSATSANVPGYGGGNCGTTGYNIQYRTPGTFDYYCATTANDCTTSNKQIPAVASTDPERTLRCDVTMADNSVLSQSTGVFHASDGAVPPYVCPAIPPDAVPTSTVVWETGGVHGDVQWTTVPTTPEYQQDRTAHPDCTLGQCRLELIRVSDGVKCLDAGASCDGWFADPAKTTNYTCKLGDYSMPLQSCYTYSPTFNQQKLSQGAPYADPTTGADTGQTVPRPAGDPSTGLDPQTGSCFPTGWGVFNPVEWIQKPVGCALQTAFVPSPSTITRLQTAVTTSWKASTPGQLQDEVTASIPEFAAADSGCGGILINFPTWNATGNYATTPEHVLAACPGDYFAQWAPLFSVFIGGAFLIGGILGIKRLISAMVGLHDMGVAG